MKNADLWIECEYGVASCVAPVAVALLTKTRKRNVRASRAVWEEGALCGARFAINIIVSQNGTIKVVSRPRNNQGWMEWNFFRRYVSHSFKLRNEKISHLPPPRIRLCSLLQHIVMDRETSCSAFCSTRDAVCSAVEKFNFANWQTFREH